MIIKVFQSKINEFQKIATKSSIANIQILNCEHPHTCTYVLKKKLEHVSTERCTDNESNMSKNKQTPFLGFVKHSQNIHLE